MCAPHQATLLPDCTAEESCLLLAVAGFNANSAFLDIYLNSPCEGGLPKQLKVVASARGHLRHSLIELPDTPEGGRQALDFLRDFMLNTPKRCQSGLPTVAATIATEKKSCCH